jgi:thiamine biosynthesis protein ThiS
LGRNENYLTLTIIVYEMGCQPTLEIIVNGDRRSAPAGHTLLMLLHDLGLEPSRVAVELDRRIVKRSEWDRVALAAGAKLEIVQFVGGG